MAGWSKSFVAVAWKLNTYNSQDEMHLFVDGFEVPNIIKYGQKLQPYLHEKFRTINPEEIVGLVNRDIVGSIDLNTTVGSNIVTSSLNFSSFNIFPGDIITINETGFNPSGYSIVSINGQTLVLSSIMPLTLPNDGRFSINQTNFIVTTDINIAPNIEVTTIHAFVEGTDMTGTMNSNTVSSASTNFTTQGVEPGFLVRIDNNSLETAYTILQVSGNNLLIDGPLPINVSPTVFQIYSTTENELPGVHALFPAYSISQDANFDNILTVSNDTKAGDLILVRTLGINHRDVSGQYYVWSSEVENILMTQLPPPISLDQANITKIILPNTVIGPANSTLSLGIFTSNNLPVSQPSNSQLGRTIDVTISGTNVDFSTPVQVTINGVSDFITISETITFTNYGTMNFANMFISVNFINVVVKPINSLKNALAITAYEKNPITVSEASGLVPIVRFSYHMGGGYTLFNDSPTSVRDINNTFSGLDIGNYLVIHSPASVAGFYIITGVSADLQSLTIQSTVTSFTQPLSNFTNGVYEVLNTTEFRSGLQNGFFTFEASDMPGQAYFLGQGFYKLDYATYMSVKFDPINTYMYFGSDINGNNQINAI